MNKNDYRILLELDKNARTTYKQLAKNAQISKESAQYRVKQLINKNILTGFYSILDVSKLGYNTNKILIKYKSVTKEIQEDIKKFLISQKIVSWCAISQGAWDLLITTIHSESQNFIKFYDTFFEKFGKYFYKKEILISVKAHAFNEKYLNNGKFIYEKIMNLQSSDNIILDTKDEEIIRQLSLNSREKFSNIANSIGLSQWATVKRYKKLVNENLITQLKPRIDFSKLGLSYYHVFIELNNEAVKSKLVDYYKMHTDCIFLMTHLGTYSIHLEFALKSEEIINTLEDLREKFGERIVNYESLLIKEEYVLNILK